MIMAASTPLLRSALLLCLFQNGDAFGTAALPTRRSSINGGGGRKMAQPSDVAAEAAACEKIDGISSPALLEKYDTFLLDMWGVVSGSFFRIVHAFHD